MNESVSDFILLLLNLGLRVTRFLLCHSETVGLSRTSHNTSLPLDIPPEQFPRTFPTPFISNAVHKLNLCIVVKLGVVRVGLGLG